MKWIFLLLILMLVPLLAGLFRSNAKAMPWAGVAIGFLPFGLAPYHLYIAPISWAGWPGTVQGVEVSVLDAVALSVLIATKRVALSKPIVLTAAFYFVAVLFATSISAQPRPGLFYVWQLIRAMLLCVAVARASARYPEFPIMVLSGAAAGLSIQALVVISQFAHGQAQAGGNFGKNMLGMMSDFIFMPALALLLEGRRTRLAIGILLVDVIVVLGGGSRATIGLFGLGAILTIGLSCWHQMTSRKVAIVAAAAVILTLAVPASIWAINRRSEEARASSNAERDSFIKAARMIIADHPLGVGANQYVLVANVGGYSAKAGVPWNGPERSAPVHNSYYLAAAEFGITGVLALIALFAATILVGLRAVNLAGRGTRPALLVGTTAAAIVLSAHIAFEWIPMTFTIHYQLAILIGTILGLRLDSLASARGTARPRQLARIVREPQPA